MGTLTFLNSPLLWGLAAGSIPIIIHLLFRRRYRRVEWAPMKYLKLTIQRNRRRIRLEQILLLLMRVAMVLLLFFFLARPVMHAEGGGRWWSSLLGGSSRTSQILVLDDSLSMGLVDGKGQRVQARAKEVAKQIVSRVGTKDRFTLVLASQPTPPLVRDMEMTDATQISKLIDDAPTGETFVSWKTTLLAIDELVASSVFPIREVTIITDMQRAGWDKEMTDLASRWAAGSVRLRVFDVGVESRKNLALVSLDQTDRLALAGAKLNWEAVVRNDSSDEARDVKAEWIVDGNPTPVLIPQIKPGSEASVPLSATFKEPGPHHVSLKLPADALPGDNQRWAVAQVQKTLKIVMVNGEPSQEPLGGEIDFLFLATALGLGDSAAFDLRPIDDVELTQQLGDKPDLLILANVATLTPDQADQITRLVRGGMGLMIFPGEQIDPDAYNRLFYGSGDGLLPAQLEAAGDEAVSGLLVEASATSTPLSALGQVSPAVLERISAKKFYLVKPPAQAEGVRVLARWNNPASSPAVIEKVFGQGKVILWTLTADKQWSDWPTDPSYVLAMCESSKAIARSDAAARSLTAGSPLRLAVPADHDVTKPAAAMRYFKDPREMRVEAEEASPGSRQPKSKSLVLADTRRAEVYTLTWTDSRSGASSDQFAVNPDVRESALARIKPEQFKNLWGTFDVEVISAAAGTDLVLATRGKEIWRTLATFLVGLVVVEACFATFVGRQR